MREAASLHSAVPVSLQSLLTLFARELAEVKFADVDRSVLEEAASRVKDAAAVVEQAEAVLEQARAKLQAEQEALATLGHRALAYARIWADGRPELLAELEALNLPRTSRRMARTEASGEASSETSAAPVRRRRARTADHTETLFSPPEEEARTN